MLVCINSYAPMCINSVIVGVCKQLSKPRQQHGRIRVRELRVNTG